MLIDDWLREKAAAGHDRQELRWLLAQVAGIDVAQQHTRREPLNAAQLAALAAALARRAAGEPLAYVLGEWQFFHLNLKVSPAVLIPRADSESVVERALDLIKEIPTPHIFDLGTGSGALALALAAFRPDSRVIAVDKSPAALAVARENGRDFANVEFRASDWFSALAGARADLIIANPPYIAAGDPHLPALGHEPRSALTARFHGYGDLFTIVKEAPDYLMPGGWLLLEHGYAQGEVLRRYFARWRRWTDINSGRDYGGRERMSWGRLA